MTKVNWVQHITWLENKELIAGDKYTLHHENYVLRNGEGYGFSVEDGERFIKEANTMCENMLFAVLRQVVQENLPRDWPELEALGLDRIVARRVARQLLD